MIDDYLVSMVTRAWSGILLTTGFNILHCSMPRCIKSVVYIDLCNVFMYVWKCLNYPPRAKVNVVSVAHGHHCAWRLLGGMCHQGIFKHEVDHWSWSIALILLMNIKSLVTPVRCVIISVQNYQQYLSLNYLCHCCVLTNTTFLCYKKCLICPIILLVHFFCSFLHLSLMQLCCHSHKQGNQTAVAAAYYRKLIPMVKMIPYISDYG